MNWKDRLLEIAGTLRGREKEKLWAFWKHDQFPFFLSGVVVDYDDLGRVSVEGYEGCQFKPFYVAAGAHGEDLHRQGKKLRAAYAVHEECCRNSAGQVAYQELASLGLPADLLGLRRTGWQGQAYQDLFKEQVERKHG